MIDTSQLDKQISGDSECTGSIYAVDSDLHGRLPDCVWAFQIDASGTEGTLPVGWAGNTAPARLQELRTRAGRRAENRETRSRSCWLRGGLYWAEGYAAKGFFAAFCCGLAGEFGFALFAALAFSFAANSCFTCFVISSTSTL